jgi:hypothetical protein
LKKDLQTNYAAQRGTGHHKPGVPNEKCQTKAYGYLLNGTGQHQNLELENRFTGNRTEGSSTGT